MEQVDIDKLRELLSTGIVNLVFTKADGSVREAVATLLPEFLPPPNPNPKKQGHAVPSCNLLFYDITVEGFRSCAIDRIISFEEVKNV